MREVEVRPLGWLRAVQIPFHSDNPTPLDSKEQLFISNFPPKFNREEIDIKIMILFLFHVGWIVARRPIPQNIIVISIKERSSGSQKPKAGSRKKDPKTK